MALTLNPTTLAAVVEKATHDAANHPRWLVAIARAIVELESNPFIARGDLHGLIIGSTSGKCYTSNGVCQCTAFEFKQPCWHRAAARLVRLHDEREFGDQVVAVVAQSAVVMNEALDQALDTAALVARLSVAREMAHAKAHREMAELFN
jgi:hypothetical protein